MISRPFERYLIIWRHLGAVSPFLFICFCCIGLLSAPQTSPTHSYLRIFAPTSPCLYMLHLHMFLWLALCHLSGFSSDYYLLRETSPTTLLKCIPCSPTTPLKEMPLLVLLEHLPSFDIIMFVYLFTCLPSAPIARMILKTETCAYFCTSIHNMESGSGYLAHEKHSNNIFPVNPGIS